MRLLRLGDAALAASAPHSTWRALNYALHSAGWCKADMGVQQKVCSFLYAQVSRDVFVEALFVANFPCWSLFKPNSCEPLWRIEHHTHRCLGSVAGVCFLESNAHGFTWGPRALATSRECTLLFVWRWGRC